MRAFMSSRLLRDSLLIARPFAVTLLWLMAGLGVQEMPKPKPGLSAPCRRRKAFLFRPEREHLLTQSRGARNDCDGGVSVAHFRSVSEKARTDQVRSQL